MTRSLRLALTAWMLGLGSSVLAQTVLVDFDTDTNGSAVPSGTAVNSLYTRYGVTFSREGGGSCGPNVYANANKPAGFGSGPNVVSTCAPPAGSDINDSGFGVIRASFDRPATQVCLDVAGAGVSGFGTLRAFNGSDALVSTASSAAGATQQVCVQGLDIRYVRFAGGSASAFARFDNLLVRFGGGVATRPFYEGVLALGAPTCSSLVGGSISTGVRTIIWSTPPGGATTARVDAVNGVPKFAPATGPAQAGSGTQQLASFASNNLGPYPFTYTMQYTTTVGSEVISVSTMAMTCVADGPAGVTYRIGLAPPSLENPQPSSFQSGIGLVSGWSCVGPFVSVSVNGAPQVRVPWGSARADTASVCGAGNTDSGFGLLTNFNILGTGNQSVQLFVNGQAFGAAVPFRSTAPAGEFISGLNRSTPVQDFPSAGRVTTLIWQQSQQNFAVQSVAP